MTELWLAGAEAIAVMGERVTATTGVLDIGGTILVTSAYLAPPYQVSAIGPTDMLDQLGKSQGWVAFIDTRRGHFGIDVSFAEPPTVEVSAFAGSLILREPRSVPASPPPRGPRCVTRVAIYCIHSSRPSRRPASALRSDPRPAP